MPVRTVLQERDIFRKELFPNTTPDCRWVR